MQFELGIQMINTRRQKFKESSLAPQKEKEGWPRAQGTSECSSTESLEHNQRPQIKEKCGGDVDTVGKASIVSYPLGETLCLKGKMYTYAWKV